MTQSEQVEFWLPKPKLWDFQTVAILIPVCSSAIGLFLMSIESLVFAQFSSMPDNLRLWISIISAIFMAFGGEIGTVSNNIFVFGRLAKKNTKFYTDWERVTNWDFAGLIVSWLGTTLSMFIASATRPDSFASWQNIFAEWLILPLMILSVSDAIFGIIEFGTAYGQFDMRMMYWIGRRKEWDEEASRKSLLESALHSTMSNTQPMPAIIEPQPAIEKTLHCWCGKELQNERAYNAHLRTHKNEVKNYNDAQSALEGLKQKYTYANPDFEFPKLSDIVEWRN